MPLVLRPIIAAESDRLFSYVVFSNIGEKWHVTFIWTAMLANRKRFRRRLRSV